MSTRHFANYYDDKTLESSSLNRHLLIEYSLNILNNCLKHVPPVQEHHDGGLYVGFIGLGYALTHVAQSDLLADRKIQLLNQAKYYVEQEMRFYSQNKRIRNETRLSFLLGHVGTLSLAARVHAQLGLKDEASRYASDFISLGEKFLPVEIHSFGSDEIFVGKSGYLLAYCLIKENCQQLGLTLSKTVLFGILDSIVNSGQQYSQKYRSRSPLMYAYYNTEYLGAGHGLTGIIFTLMKYRDYLNERPAVVAMIQQCLDYMIAVTPADGNLPPATDDIGRKYNQDSQLSHWCHGAAGAVYAYARAYLLWGQEKYLQAAIKCGDVIWKYGLLKKGPGICHGVAGSGYVFLVLYRLTKNELYINRANSFCTFLSSDEFKQGARIPDNPHSLFEGWAGTACFISDLASLNSASFPFFDVFD